VEGAVVGPAVVDVMNPGALSLGRAGVAVLGRRLGMHQARLVREPREPGEAEGAPGPPPAEKVDQPQELAAQRPGEEGPDCPETAGGEGHQVEPADVVG